MRLDLKIEALLFYKAMPLNKINLMKQLECTVEDFHDAIEIIRERQKDSALRLIETEAEVQLVTAPEVAEFITDQQKDETKGDIGKAGAETLAIVLYREPVSRAEIDRIRGVNSSFILRNLMVRGLIERKSGKGGHLYHISPLLLQHLGVEQKYNLPRYSEFMNAIEAFEHTHHE